MKQLTKEQILKETIKFYSTNPRGINGKGHCQYLTNEGDMCAVGRCLTLKARKEAMEYIIGDYCELQDFYDGSVPFLKRYQGHNYDFWNSLQDFHDSNDNWKSNDKGGYDLTETGQSRYKLFLQNIKAGNYELKTED